VTLEVTEAVFFGGEAIWSVEEDGATKVSSLIRGVAFGFGVFAVSVSRWKCGEKKSAHTQGIEIYGRSGMDLSHGVFCRSRSTMGWTW